MYETIGPKTLNRCSRPRPSSKTSYPSHKDTSLHSHPPCLSSSTMTGGQGDVMQSSSSNSRGDDRRYNVNPSSSYDPNHNNSNTAQSNSRRGQSIPPGQSIHPGQSAFPTYPPPSEPSSIPLPSTAGRTGGAISPDFSRQPQPPQISHQSSYQTPSASQEPVKSVAVDGRSSSMSNCAQVRDREGSGGSFCSSQPTQNAFQHHTSPQPRHQSSVSTGKDPSSNAPRSQGRVDNVRSLQEGGTMNSNNNTHLYPSSSTMSPPNPYSSHGGGGGGRIVSHNHRAPAFSHADQAQMSLPSSSSSSLTQRKGGVSLGDRPETGRASSSAPHHPSQDEALRRNGGAEVSSSVYRHASHETSRPQSYYATTTGDPYGGRAAPGAVSSGQYRGETEGEREREASNSKHVVQTEDHTTSSGLYPPPAPQNSSTASRQPLPSSHYYPQRGIGNPMMSSYSSSSTSSYTGRRSEPVNQAPGGGGGGGAIGGGHEGAPRSVKEHQEYLLKQAAGGGEGGGAAGEDEANRVMSRMNEGRGVGMEKRQEGMDGNQESLNFYRQVHPSHPTPATSLHYAKAYPPPSSAQGVRRKRELDVRKVHFKMFLLDSLLMVVFVLSFGRGKG